MAYHRRMWQARNGVGSLGFRNQFLGLADPRPIGSLLILASQPLNRPPPAMDLRPDNPCDRIGPVLRAEGDVVRHVRALRRGDVAQAINTVGGGGGPPVFTDGSGKPLHGQRLPRFLRHHAIAAVPHGFRSSFRDWAAEETDHPREVVEAALAPVVRNKVEAAYRRTDLFERWR